MKWQGKADAIAKEIAFDTIRDCLPEKRRETLVHALDRNCHLTSAWTQEICEYTVYKEGWYFLFRGTRSGFGMYVADRDGEYEVTRKPADSKLHKLYDGWFRNSEADFFDVLGR